MAWDFDAATSQHLDTDSTATDHTFSHTVGADVTSGILVVGFMHAWPSGSSVTSAQYGGQNLTLAGTATYESSSGETLLYYLANPPAGSNTLSLKTSQPLSSTLGAVSYDGANINDPVGPVATATDADVSNGISVSVTSSDGDLVVDAVSFSHTSNATLSVGAGQTSRVEEEGNRRPLGMSEESATGSSVTMSWTGSASRPGGIVAVALQPQPIGGNQVVYFMSTNTWWDKINDIMRPKKLEPIPIPKRRRY